MKNKICLIAVVFLIIITCFGIKTYAADLDVIESFVVKANPLDNGVVNFVYQIKWKVLDSTSEGPLTWVKIGLPNAYAESIKSITDNIKSIKKSGSYVEIYFDDSYYAGETITFTFSFNQPFLCQEKDGKYVYEYTPAWFDNCKVKSLLIYWNEQGVDKSDNNKTKDGYLIWSKENLTKGQKVEAVIKYDMNYFSGVETKKELDDVSKIAIFVIAFLFIYLIAKIASVSSYSNHRGYYGGSIYRSRPYHYGHGRSNYSSTSSVFNRALWEDEDDSDRFGGFGDSDSSCACACACAGSGRAGCSKKDFFGTKLKSEELIEELKK